MADQIEIPYPPSIAKKDFNCPHCGAHSNQTWFTLAADPIEKNGTPIFPDAEFLTRIQTSNLHDKEKNRLIRWVDRMTSGFVFLEIEERSIYSNNRVCNLYLSKCFTCESISVWVHDDLLFPNQRYTIAANKDLPDDVKNDYEEASKILDISPRGSAALLRLAIQKLCIHLGESGKNINADIASLVRKGLDKRVQQALDIVRVVGNEAVHPGQMDIKDNKGTAKTLFSLVNLIAEKMISEPKHIQNLFDSLPAEVRKQIEKRDS